MVIKAIELDPNVFGLILGLGEERKLKSLNIIKILDIIVK
jgi:hypothetical protein